MGSFKLLGCFLGLLDSLDKLVIQNLSFFSLVCFTLMISLSFDLFSQTVNVNIFLFIFILLFVNPFAFLKFQVVHHRTKYFIFSPSIFHLVLCMTTDQSTYLAFQFDEFGLGNTYLR